AGIGRAPSARLKPPIARASAALRGSRVARRSRRQSERRAISRTDQTTPARSRSWRWITPAGRRLPSARMKRDVIACRSMIATASAERAAGMEEREVLGREAALLEKRDGERVAERHGRGRAGRGRETERAGLLRHAHVEDDVRAAREGRLEVAADGNQREAEAARQRQEAQHLGALAAVRDREQYVAAHERAEIAVAALAGVQEEGGRAGRGERGGDLPAHDAGLADARDDHPPAAGEQELDGAREAPVEAVGERAQGPPLDVEHAPRAREPRLGG